MNTENEQKKLPKQRENSKAQQKKIVVIDSEVITRLNSFREIGWNQDAKINKEDSKVRNYFHDINVSPGSNYYQGTELFEIVNKENGLKKTISLPCFITLDGKLMSMQKANPTLFADIVIGRINLMKSKEVRSKQEELIDSFSPLLESKKFSFISLLPLIQDRSTLNFNLEVDRLAIAFDTADKPDPEDSVLDDLQDIVREDDIVKTSIPLLNSTLVTHPKVAPILARLFEKDKKTDGETRSKKSITI